MSQQQMQEKRVELKFVVSEAVAEQISAAASKHLVLDAHSARQQDASYPVHSLYLDSECLDSYWATARRKENRFKLRIRFYDDEPDTPVYVEVKKRAEGQTLKQRCPVPRGELHPILSGELEAHARSVLADPKHGAALSDFLAKVRLLEAAPKLHIAYQREAYVSRDDNSIRLTLDRAIRSEPAESFRVSTNMRHPKPVCENTVVLEFKFSGAQPRWFAQVVERLGLRRTGLSKYVAAVAQHGLQAPTLEKS